jgi:large subunit ribosomal protein L9
MQVILLEKHKKLGNFGDIVKVKDGFARNFLIPNKKAMQTTKENIEFFQERKEAINKEIEKKQTEAKKTLKKLDSKWIYILKQAGEDGRLYGSVNSIELINAIKEQHKEELNKNNIQLLEPIKSIGVHEISVNIFADVYAKMSIMVARTKEEAELRIKEAVEEMAKPKASTLFKKEASESDKKEEASSEASTTEAIDPLEFPEFPDSEEE